MKTPKEQIDEAVKIQCSNGNWNYDPYMHGMANGMLFAQAVIENREPVYLEAPKQWLKDKAKSYELTTQLEHTPPKPESEHIALEAGSKADAEYKARDTVKLPTQGEGER